MPIMLLNFFSKPENIIGSILIAIIIALGAHNFILKHEVKSRDNTIAEQKVNLLTLKNNVVTLQSSLNEQNKAIEIMNKEQVKSVEDFNKKYNDLKDSQKGLIKQIEKQYQYVSPKGINECDASKMVIEDFIKNRK